MVCNPESQYFNMAPLPPFFWQMHNTHSEILGYVGLRVKVSLSLFYSVKDTF